MKKATVSGVENCNIKNIFDHTSDTFIVKLVIIAYSKWVNVYIINLQYTLISVKN